MRLIIPPPAVGLICALLIWYCSTLQLFGEPTFPYQNAIAISIVVVGLLIDIMALGLFRKFNTTVNPVSPSKSTSLVTNGIYAYTRNPMYLGMALLLCGWSVYLGEPAGLIIVMIFVFYITRFQIMPEEEILLEKFGVEYADYLSKVRRWI